MLEDIWRKQTVVERLILQHAPFRPHQVAINPVPDENALEHLDLMDAVADRADIVEEALVTFWKMSDDPDARLQVLEAALVHEASLQSYIQYASARNAAWSSRAVAPNADAFKAELVGALGRSRSVTDIRVTPRSGRLDLEIDERRGDTSVTWHLRDLNASPQLAADFVTRLRTLAPPELHQERHPARKGRQDTLFPER